MTMTLDGSGANTIGVPNSATAKSATGTSVDFTGIPAGIKRITVMFAGVSTNGTSPFLVRIGTSGGIDTTGYDSACGYGGTGGQYESSTVGFNVTASGTMSASNTYKGVVTICAVSSTVYVSSGVVAGTVQNSSGGTKTLSGTLDRVRITTVNGTDTFDAGSINILFE